LHTMSTVERLSAYEDGHGGSCDKVRAERQARSVCRMVEGPREPT